MRMYTYACIYTHINVFKCARTYACMHVLTHVHARMHVYVCMCVLMYVCMYVCMYACNRVCMHSCIYVCLQVCVPLTLQVKGRADASGKFVNSGLHIHTQAPAPFDLSLHQYTQLYCPRASPSTG